MIDDLVQVFGDLLGDLVQFLVIERAIRDETGQRQRGKVADGDLIG